jgi:hypothetical protein
MLGPDAPPPPDAMLPRDAPADALSSYRPVVAGSPGGFGVAWTDYAAGTPSVLFQMLDGTGTPISDKVLISSGASIAIAHSMVWNGTDFALVYAEGGHSFVRIKESGQRVAPAKKIDTDNATIQLIPAGTGYGVVRRSMGSIKFAKLDASASQILNDQILFSASGVFDQISIYGSPKMAFGDGHFGIAWAVQKSSSLKGGPIHFARVTQAGAMVGTPLVLEGGSHSFLSVGYGNGHFAITWHESGEVALEQRDHRGHCRQLHRAGRGQLL